MDPAVISVNIPEKIFTSPEKYTHCLSQDPLSQKYGQVDAIDWQVFLERLWAEEILIV